MGTCRDCGREIGFSLTRYCNECYKKHRLLNLTSAEEQNYRRKIEQRRTLLEVFDQGKNTVVMDTGYIRKEYLARYGEEHGYEVQSISSDADPEFPIETVIFKKPSIMGEWECQYCKTTNGGNFCANCGSPRRR